MGLRTEKGHKAGRDETEGEGKGGPSVNMAPEDFCVEDFQVKMMQPPQKTQWKNIGWGRMLSFFTPDLVAGLGFLAVLVDR